MNTIPATGAKIKDTIKTYKQVNGEMIHDGYFYILQDAPLKWCSNWQHDLLVKMNPLKRTDMAYRLPNAQ